jgi:hypothetical protein
VLDQIPISGDQRINVSLIEPAQLEFGGRSTIGASSNTLIKSYISGVGEKLAFPPEAKIAKGVSVRWKVVDEDDMETGSMKETSGPPGLDGAREGMLEWICEIPNGKSVDLSLVWEVSAPSLLNWGPR